MNRQLRERFERRINAYYRACGCFEGGISVLLTIAMLVTWSIFFSEHQAYAWPDVAMYVGIVLLVAVLGKWLGHVRAHLALGTTLRELARDLAALGDEGRFQ